MISDFAAAEGMSLVAIYADEEIQPSDTRPGLAALLEAVGRSDRAVVLVPDMTHLPCSQGARRSFEDQVAALGSVIVPLVPPARIPAQAAPTDRQHPPRSREGSQNSAPSPAVRVAVERFPALLSSVPDARAAACRVLQVWRLGSEAVDTATLIVSELTANAAKASPAGGIVVVRLTASGGSLLIEVWDNAAALPVLRDPDSDGEDGRGLLLVTALSSRWSWYRSKSGGKVVWAALHANLPQPTQPRIEAGQLDQRTPQPTPDPLTPVTFEEDPALLRRVADGLRALDDWHLPHATAAPPRKRPPIAATGHPERV